MYRTTKEENEILTRVGSGTPMGELLRRYCWPIAISAHLSPDERIQLREKAA